MDSVDGVKRIKAVVNVTIVLSVVVVNISLEVVDRIQHSRKTSRDLTEGAKCGPY